LIGNASDRDRSYEQGLRQKVEKLNLRDTVEFIGALPNGQVADWYRRCFAHVNLCPTGALDKAALEAMACGKPSLVANEGFFETLGPWKDSLLFKHGDPRDLAQKIERLVSLPDQEYRTMALELRQRVFERHSLGRLTGNLMHVFENLQRH
jgi:glycosyltransferase involved in cell wall biosynthesis